MLVEIIETNGGQRLTANAGFRGFEHSGDYNDWITIIIK